MIPHCTRGGPSAEKLARAVKIPDCSRTHAATRGQSCGETGPEKRNKMAEITKKRMGELVRGVFTILVDAPEGLPAAQILEMVVKAVPPTPFEAGFYEKHPTVRRYEKIVRFSTINAVKAGWLVKDKGQWSLTEEGRAAYTEFSDPEAFYAESQRLYRAWKKAQPVETDDGEESDGEAEAAATLEEAEETAWSEIQNYLVAMPPYEFQELVGALLRLWTAPPGPDRGIDLIAHNDRLGTTTPRIKVQVKRQAQNKIAVEGIRAFLAVLGDDDVGIYISAGGFTSEAEREARSQEKRRLTLIDLSRLVDLWVEHYDRIEDEDRRRLPLTAVYYLSPA